MKLTRASSYALHAVAYLASQKGGTPITSQVIAQKRGIPEGFLLKLLNPLVTARVLFSIKGPNGGYRLAKKPTEITLLEIIEAVDGPIRGVAPGMQTEKESSLDRQLSTVCDQIAAQVRRQLQKVRVSDLMGKAT